VSSTGNASHTLHEVNCRLHCMLDSLSHAPAQSSASAAIATPQQMAGLLSELMCAGEGLRELPAERNPEFEHELSQYRKNVERLRAMLPAIHQALLRERARLEQERNRLEAATAWARGSRETL